MIAPMMPLVTASSIRYASSTMPITAKRRSPPGRCALQEHQAMGSVITMKTPTSLAS